MRVGCSEMGLKGRWLFRALLAVAIVALAGCASGPYSGDPCGGILRVHGLALIRRSLLLGGVIGELKGQSKSWIVI